MSSDAEYDLKRLGQLGLIGGTLDAAVVDSEGFLVLIVSPKEPTAQGRLYPVALSVSRDHEGNGPGALITDVQSDECHNCQEEFALAKLEDINEDDDEKDPMLWCASCLADNG